MSKISGLPIFGDRAGALGREEGVTHNFPTEFLNFLTKKKNCQLRSKS